MHVVLRGKAARSDRISAGRQEPPQLCREARVVRRVAALNLIADQLGDHAVIGGTGALRDARVGRVIGRAAIVGRRRRKPGHHWVKRGPWLRRRRRAG